MCCFICVIEKGSDDNGDDNDDDDDDLTSFNSYCPSSSRSQGFSFIEAFSLSSRAMASFSPASIAGRTTNNFLFYDDQLVKD